MPDKYPEYSDKVVHTMEHFVDEYGIIQKNAMEGKSRADE